MQNELNGPLLLALMPTSFAWGDLDQWDAAQQNQLSLAGQKKGGQGDAYDFFRPNNDFESPNNMKVKPWHLNWHWQPWKTNWFSCKKTKKNDRASVANKKKRKDMGHIESARHSCWHWTCQKAWLACHAVQTLLWKTPPLRTECVHYSMFLSTLESKRLRSHIQNWKDMQNIRCYERHDHKNLSYAHKPSEWYLKSWWLYNAIGQNQT